MHEPFEPKCTFCTKFVRCYPDDSPLAEWGYCAEGRDGSAPSRQALAGLEEQARGGSYGRLLEGASAVGLYQETDDGCERFEGRVAASPTRRPSG